MFRVKVGHLLFIAALLFFPWPSLAVGTAISSNITSPDWTPDNSPYVVSGTINVTPGALLKIEAGTEIRFEPGAKIVVDGELQVLGTPANPVTMTLDSAASSTNPWGGIVFNSDAKDATFENGQYASGSIIENAIIKFGQGIQCVDASPYIYNNQIMNNATGLEISGTAGQNGGLALTSGTTNPNSGIVIPIFVKNNVFTDNGTAVLIDRSNSQSYLLTPAGYSYIGSPIITAVLDGNSLNSNSVGLNISSGDNNVIINNTIKYNSVAGILAGTTSRANVFEKNTVNNNQIGVDMAAADSIIAQNAVKNNFSFGLHFAARPKFFQLNDIYNNQNYNLENVIYNLNAINNYWGSTDPNVITNTFLTTATSTSASSTSALVNPVIFQPFLSAETSLSAIFAPQLDAYSTTTVSDNITLSGVKPYGTSVSINGAVISSDLNSYTWSAIENLELGDNVFSIFYSDATGAQSDRLAIHVRRDNEVVAPTLSSSLSNTTATSIVLSGTKPAGTGLLINGSLAVAATNATTWTYATPLSVGVNNFEFIAQDANGQQSVSLDVNITRTVDTSASVVSTEKNLAGTLDPKLAAKLAGRLLLQVETNGYIWYLNPKDNKRYFISQDSALSIFRSLALGITEANLNLIPTKASGQTGNAALRARLKGRLLLRVENGGQISYVDVNGYRNDIDASNLMSIFRSLSLGIANANLRKIAVGTVSAQ